MPQRNDIAVAIFNVITDNNAVGNIRNLLFALLPAADLKGIL